MVAERATVRNTFMKYLSRLFETGDGRFAPASCLGIAMVYGLFRAWIIGIFCLLGEGAPYCSEPSEMAFLIAAALTACFVACNMKHKKLIQAVLLVSMSVAAGAVLVTVMEATTASLMVMGISLGVIFGCMTVMIAVPVLSLPYQSIVAFVAIGTVIAATAALGLVLLPTGWLTVFILVGAVLMMFFSSSILNNRDTSPATIQPERSFALPRFSFVRFLAALIVFVSTMRLFDSLLFASSAGHLTSAAALQFLGQIIAGVFVLIMLLVLHRRFPIASVYRYGLPAMALGFILLSLDLLFPVAVTLVSLGNEFFGLIGWVLMYMFAKHRGACMWKTLGIAFLVDYLSMAFGIATGIQFSVMGLFSLDSGMLATVSFLCVVLLVFVAVIVLPDGQIEMICFGRRMSQADAGLDLDTGTSLKKPTLEQRCSQVAQAHGLTSREAEVLVLLAQGRTLKVIARDLCISNGTVGTHIAKVYQKTGVHCQQALIDLVNEAGSRGRDAF